MAVNRAAAVAFQAKHDPGVRTPREGHLTKIPGPHQVLGFLRMPQPLTWWPGIRRQPSVFGSGYGTIEAIGSSPVGFNEQELA
jgi:hypothetical protein